MPAKAAMHNAVRMAAAENCTLREWKKVLVCLMELMEMLDLRNE